MLNVAHAFCFLNAKLLTLLVPAPLINLPKGEPSAVTDHFERFFAPVRVYVEMFIQSRQLVYILPLPFANNALHLLCISVKEVTPA